MDSWITEAFDDAIEQQKDKIVDMIAIVETEKNDYINNNINVNEALNTQILLEYNNIITNLTTLKDEQMY